MSLNASSSQAGPFSVETTVDEEPRTCAYMRAPHCPSSPPNNDCLRLLAVIAQQLRSEAFALSMLSERLTVLDRYLEGVLAGRFEPSCTFLRQIAGVVQAVPVTVAPNFRSEMAKVSLTTPRRFSVATEPAVAGSSQRAHLRNEWAQHWRGCCVACLTF